VQLVKEPPSRGLSAAAVADTSANVSGDRPAVAAFNSSGVSFSAAAKATRSIGVEGAAARGLAMLCGA
jgi:hypothetical protein